MVKRRDFIALVGTVVITPRVAHRADLRERSIALR